MLLKKLLDTIETVFPLQSAIPGDRIGLQVQSGKRNISKVLVTLELNGEVLNEAKEEFADCIVSFHPLIYNPLTSITELDRVGRLCTSLIENSIALVIIHTNFDTYFNGTSKILAEKLGYTVSEILVPDTRLDKTGMGVVAVPKRPLKAADLLRDVGSICRSPLRYCMGKSNSIKKIAIVGGSGSAFLENAIAAGADAFITADVTYHTYHRAAGEIMLIDPGHYEMEQFVPRALAGVLRQKLASGRQLGIIASKIRTNPVEYYPDSNNYSAEQIKYLINNKEQMKTDGTPN